MSKMIMINDAVMYRLDRLPGIVYGPARVEGISETAVILNEYGTPTAQERKNCEVIGKYVKAEGFSFLGFKSKPKWKFEASTTTKVDA